MRDTHRELVASVTRGMETLDFFSSILAGFLLGLLVDWLAGTRPVFIIVGIVAGATWGFWKLKRMSDDELARWEEQHGPR